MSYAKSIASQFEKASKVKTVTMEEQRQRAKFESRRSKFEVTSDRPGAPTPANHMERRHSEVARKASLFSGGESTGDVEARERAEREAKERKASYDKARMGFVAGKMDVEMAPEEDTDSGMGSLGSSGSGVVQRQRDLFTKTPEEVMKEAEEEERRMEEERERKEAFKKRAMSFQS